MAYDIRFNVGQTGADTIDQITAKMTVMKAQITATGLEMRQAGNRVADAQKQIAEGAAFIAPLLAKEQAVLDGLVIKQREQKAALDALTSAIEKTTAATVQATTATVKLGAAHTAMVPQVAAASAAIRTFEGAMPIRAVERFAVNVLGLGPILQAAFPIVGLIAFSEIFSRTFEKIDPFIQAEKKLDESTKTLDKSFENLGKRFERLKIREMIDLFGAAAGAKLGAFYAGTAAAEKNAAADALQPQIDKAARSAANYSTLAKLVGGTSAAPFTRLAAAKAADALRLSDQQAFLRQDASADKEDAAKDVDDAVKDKNKTAAEKAKQEAARRKTEERRVQTMERAGITNPVGRAYMKANDDVESFTDPDLKARALQAGIADASRAGLTESNRVNKELATGREEQQRQGRETAKRAEENFHREDNEKIRKLNEDQEAANKVKTFQNSLTTESTSEAVRINAAKGGGADKMIGLNRSLSDAQKISLLNQQDLATAAQKYQIEKDGAAQLLGEDERAKARHKADLDNEFELQKIKEENAEKIAALEDKDIQEFRSLIGGLFDAATSHSPNAIPNFIKGQVLKVGQTITENAAQAYLLPAITKLIPTTPGGALGAILKGTGLTKDPLQPAGTQLYSAGTQLIAAARALAMSRTGVGGGMPGGGGGITFDADGNPTGTSAVADDLPISAGGTSIGLTSSVSAGFGFNGGTIASIAGAAAGSIVAAKDFSAGGVGKDLQGAGAVAGITAAIIPLIPALTAAFPPAGAIAAVAAVGLSMIGSFINAPQRRANAINTELGQAQYIAPQALNATQDSSGDFTDFDARGNIRTSNFSAIPTVRQGSTWEQTHGLFGGPPTFYTVPGGQTSQFGAPNGGTTAPAPPPQTVIINAMDSQSFNDFAEKNHMAIGNAASKAMQNGHGALTTEVQRAANP